MARSDLVNRKFPSALHLRHSLGGRILAGFLMMVLISLFLAVAGIFYTNQAGTNLRSLIEGDQRVTNAILNMELAVERQASSVRGFLLLPKNEEIGKSELANARLTYTTSSQDLQTAFRAVEVNRLSFGKIEDLYNQFTEVIEDVLAINREDFYSAPSALWEQEGQNRKNQLIEAINTALDNYREQIENSIREARNQSSIITLISLGLVIFAALVCGLITTFLTRSITKPLRNLAGVAQAIRNGDLTVKVPPVRGNDEVAFLSSAMDRMAQNLRQSRAELEESLNHTRRRNRELTAVNRVSAAISQSLDLEKVLQEALQQMMLAAEVEFSSLFLLDETGEYLNLAAHYGQSEDYLENYKRVKVGEQLTGQVAATGNVLLTIDPGKDLRVTAGILRRELEKRFYMGVPLKSKGRVVGVANLTSVRVRSVSESEMELFSAIGSQIGIAIENARLYQQAQQLAALEERNRLARDLHDSVTQTLFSITLTAESARAMLVKKPDKIPLQLERLQSLARGALAEMRALIFQLRPAELEEQGLVAALEKHVAVVRSKEGIEIDFQVENLQERRLSTEHEQALYRIAQEALNNIQKHAGASKIRVKLVIDEMKATLVVQDDGVGFDPGKQAIQNNKDRNTLGMTSMRERAELAGGTLIIESQPEKGATVIASLPHITAPRPVGLGIN